MTKQKVFEVFTQLAYNFSSENQTEKKLDLLLSKLDNSIMIRPPEVKSDKHLLIHEVCELTRKSRVTIWLWRKKGLLLPCGKSGKNPIYKRSDVLNFLYKSEDTTL
ncbi:helix-turn-helix transcriptional regulator [Elizabethkingia anophelis]|uniref:helix-turn-helix transcriptional regulator n=1 Tax=Elizabethkingia anophelis TaxID=1117645 RepID=UPI000C9C1A86|nr:helix-turn-helix domain-containing protein [Elizabethkingia anophelis]HAY3563421.1 helix-turn-helix domain-containing protein [Elizabethkingia meningoseptica]MCT3646542.1 helix-turn-helix domain-containing protein [Elizabethkingia anophelis]MCT3647628.1 helix-turn-helix domain-containing protein [Elizabethkingia anophelis]MCT3694151.1 helix-turn-helix domain-containing protein [Elizabethkingia anophelis]MCT3759789.1 helix-turn-helix domain-containing protein [Elizabethkingia anophelis]